jgi:hypothetical protein
LEEDIEVNADAKPSVEEEKTGNRTFSRALKSDTFVPISIRAPGGYANWHCLSAHVLIRMVATHTLSASFKEPVTPDS